MITLTFNQVTAAQFLQNKMIEFKFEVEYFMDMTRAIEDVKVGLIFLVPWKLKSGFLKF